jgi:chemotaxis protein CheX
MINSCEISEITQNVLATMMQLEATNQEADESTMADRGVTGCIQISGQWQGAVVLQASKELATLVASRLLDVSPSDISEEDIRDCFAELTNMIGGNIKGQVPCPSYLSIPSVTQGSDFGFHLPGSIVVEDVRMVCENDTLRILLCEAENLVASLPARGSR